MSISPDIIDDIFKSHYGGGIPDLTIDELIYNIFPTFSTTQKVRNKYVQVYNFIQDYISSDIFISDNWDQYIYVLAILSKLNLEKIYQTLYHIINKHEYKYTTHINKLFFHRFNFNVFNTWINDDYGFDEYDLHQFKRDIIDIVLTLGDEYITRKWNHIQNCKMEELKDYTSLSTTSDVYLSFLYLYHLIRTRSFYISKKFIDVFPELQTLDGYKLYNEERYKAIVHKCIPFILFHLYKTSKNRNNLLRTLRYVLSENARYKFTYAGCDDILLHFIQYMRTPELIKKFMNIIYIDDINKQQRITYEFDKVLAKNLLYELHYCN